MELYYSNWVCRAHARLYDDDVPLWILELGFYSQVEVWCCMRRPLCQPDTPWVCTTWWDIEGHRLPSNITRRLMSRCQRLWRILIHHAQMHTSLPVKQRNHSLIFRSPFTLGSTACQPASALQGIVRDPSTPAISKISIDCLDLRT